MKMGTITLKRPWEVKMMKQLKGRLLVYLAVTAILVLGALVVGPIPAASGQCDCQGGYNYANDGKPCSPGGTNCAWCNCPAK